MRVLIVWALLAAVSVGVTTKVASEAQKEVTTLYNQIEQAFPHD